MSHQSAVAPRRGVMILTAMAMASEHMSITNTPVQSSPLEATPARSGPSAAPTEPVPVGRSHESYLDHTGHSRHQVRDWGGEGQIIQGTAITTYNTDTNTDTDTTTPFTSGNTHTIHIRAAERTTQARNSRHVRMRMTLEYCRPGCGDIDRLSAFSR